MRLYILAAVFCTVIASSCTIRKSQTVTYTPETVTVTVSPARDIKIRPGAERTRQYFHSLKHDRKVAVVANQTSMIDTVHLVDSMLAEGIKVVKIFTPEHGFRGAADAGQLINNEIDSQSGLPVISLYGSHKKPTSEDLAGVDIVVFDLQDVGARFYTYISTLTLVMEACAENNIPLLVLDRPNPNGFYVDGPILEPKQSSFIGMHPVPVVHGMTIAEYARMVNGENWLKDSLHCDLDWVECAGYNHKSHYSLPIKPSPNLPDMNSVILYPTLCFFEGTKVSVGRGTDTPFSIIGYPGFPNGNYQFTPQSRIGALSPPYKDQQCNGYILTDSVSQLLENPGLRINWLIHMYQADTGKSSFFTSFFTKLAGTEVLRRQIESGMNENEIRSTWNDDLIKFMETRKKYLLYRDF